MVKVFMQESYVKYMILMLQWVHCLLILIFIVLGQGCRYRCLKMYISMVNLSKTYTANI